MDVAPATEVGAYRGNRVNTFADDDEPLAPQLEVDELTADEATQVIALTGELDVATVEGFNAAVQRAVSDGAATVVADLTRLTFMDSSGLAAMLGALRSLDHAGARLLIACANPTVLRVFEITGTEQTFEILPTREQALARVRHGVSDPPA
jgi:anti-sigma B factor antagonist